jgi:hypothetical protein
MTVAGLVAEGTTVHVALGALVTVTTLRGRFMARSGLMGDARNVMPASATSARPAPN